jgi:hypothetical protein
MIRYRNKARFDREQGQSADFWSADLIQELQERDCAERSMFSQDTDLAFFLSSDGVKVFKSRRAFHIWPLLLINLNLPPNIRYKKTNMLLVGFIPGPKEPHDIDSFLYPLVQEFKKLGQGIPAYNAARKHLGEEAEFTMRAYITIVGADMIGRSKLMHTTGNRSYPYCEYCGARGIWNSAIYCPVTAPSDAPEKAKSRDGSGYPWSSLDRSHLPLRKDTAFRATARHIAQDLCDGCQKKYGIRGPSILQQLRSLDFPRSFPPDLMHLMYENVIPALFRHFRGVFFRSNKKRRRITAAESESQEEDIDEQMDSNDENAEASGTEVDSHRVSNKPSSGKNVQKGSEKLAKFVETDDPWNIKPEDWTEIGKAFDESAAWYPLAFGEPLGNFTRHCHELKAAEWLTVTKHAAPIFLKTLLPEQDYDGFLLLVDAITLLEKPTMTRVEQEEVGRLLRSFSSYYEERFYRAQWKRLKACLPTFHQLLHMKDATSDLGPAYVFWQWPMERYVST